MESVVFLLTEAATGEGNGWRPAGTGFLISYPLGGGEIVYIVTARHVVEQSLPTGTLSVRFNRSGGGFQDFPCPRAKWLLSESTDLAMMPIVGRIIAQSTSHHWVPFDCLMDDVTAGKYQLSVGDDVFSFQMLGSQLGSTRAEPIMRRGYIAAIPNDPVRIKVAAETFAHVPAHLCELTSVGGHSGAPVFMVPPMYRIPKIAMPVGWPVLLGVVQGHRNGSLDDTTDGSVNTGISVVLRWDSIMTMFESPQLVEHRDSVVAGRTTAENDHRTVEAGRLLDPNG